jgi:hypothetical protein
MGQPGDIELQHKNDDGAQRTSYAPSRSRLRCRSGGLRLEQILAVDKLHRGHPSEAGR